MGWFRLSLTFLLENILVCLHSTRFFLLLTFTDSFITNITGSPTPIILFLVVPITLMTLSSTIFRRILSSMQKSLRAHPYSQIIVQLVPEHVINYMENDPASTDQLESFCINLYNRILVSVEQPLARRFSPDNTPITVKALLQKPVFTLARPTYNTVTYTRTAFSSLDVMDRYTLLHVGYRLSACGKWVMAACVDQRGEAWEQAVWLLNQDVDGEGNGSSAPIGGSSEEMFVVKKIWDFVAGFAVRADVEWRIVISKLGIMEEAEFTGMHPPFLSSAALVQTRIFLAWTNFLPAVLAMDYPHSVDVSLLCVNPDSPWLFTKFDTAVFSSQPDNSNKTPVYSDVSSTTYSASLNIVLPIATPPSQHDIGISLPYVADPSSPNNDGEPDSTNSSSTMTTPTTPPPVTPTTPRKTGLLPRLTSCLIRVPCSAPLTSISMLNIHLLSTYSSSSLREEDYNMHNNNKSDMLDLKVILADVTQNFYELSVLAQLQWKLSGADGVATNGGSGGSGSRGGGGGSGGSDARFKTGANPILPVHLAMVDIMGQVTDDADCTEFDP
jgi:mediator of RNA polymerase II transcription subunit 13